MFGNFLDQIRQNQQRILDMPPQECTAVRNKLLGCCNYLEPGTSCETAKGNLRCYDSRTRNSQPFI